MKENQELTGKETGSASEKGFEQGEICNYLHVVTNAREKVLAEDLNGQN